LLMTDIGLLKNYVGKHFYIRCQQNLQFVIDSRFRQNLGGGQFIIYSAVANNVNQIWTVDAAGHIINVQNPNYIIYAENTREDTRPTVIGMKGNPKAQTALAKWHMNAAGEIVSLANTGFMLNVAGFKMANSTPVIMYHRQGPAFKNDKWKLDVLSTPVPKPSDIGQFKNFIGKRFFIKCQQNPGFVLDTAANQGKGGPTHLWEFWEDCKNQIWTVDAQGHLINAQNPDWILYGDNTNDDVKPLMVRVKGNPEAETDLARWSMNAAGEIVSMANSGAMLNVAGFCMANGTPIIMYHRQRPQDKNDKWIIQLEIDYAKKERDTAKNEKDEAIKQKNTAFDQLNAAQREKEEAQQQLSNAKTQLTKKTKELDDQIGRLKKETETLTKQRDEAKQAAEKAEKEKKDAQAQADEVKAELDKKKAEIEKIKAEMDKMRTDAKNKIDKIQAETAKIKAETQKIRGGTK